MVMGAFRLTDQDQCDTGERQHGPGDDARRDASRLANPVAAF
jgi:hypothetical protein